MKVPSQAMGKTATCVKCGEKMRISVETTNPTQGGVSNQENSSPGDSSSPAPDVDNVVQLLVQHGLVTDQHIEEALLVQTDVLKPLWLLLMEMGCVSTQDFHSLMVKQKGTASIDLAHYNIPTEMTLFLDKELVHQKRIMPVDKLGKLLTLAMVCPMDSQTIQDVEHITGLKVKTMLCSMNDMNQTLKNYVRIDIPVYDDVHTTQLGKELQTQFLNFECILKALKCESLPPYTAIVQRLKAAQHENDRTTVDLMDIIANDPVLSALTLRVANSAAYAFPNAVDTLGMAAALLGTEGLIKIASSTPAIDYTQLKPPFEYQDWILQTQFCGRAVKQIYTTTGNPEGMAAYSAALLHTLGRFTMLHLFPNSYGPSTQSLRGQALFEKELSLYGISHPELGYVIARKWNLPANVADAIRYQRNWQEATKTRDTTAVLSLALQMTDSYIEDKPLALEECSDLLLHLGISQTAIGDMYRETVEQFSGAISPQNNEPRNNTPAVT